MPISETGRDPVAGTIIRTVEIPARYGAAVEVTRGQVVRVIDVEGAQVGDLVCFNRRTSGRPTRRRTRCCSTGLSIRRSARCWCRTADAR